MQLKDRYLLFRKDESLVVFCIMSKFPRSYLQDYIVACEKQNCSLLLSFICMISELV